MKRFFLISLFTLGNFSLFLASEMGETPKKGVLSGITGIFKRKKKAPQNIINKFQARTNEKKDLEKSIQQDKIKLSKGENKLQSIQEQLSELDPRDTSDVQKIRALHEFQEQEGARIVSLKKTINRLEDQIKKINKELEGYLRKYQIPLNLQEE